MKSVQYADLMIKKGGPRETIDSLTPCAKWQEDQIEEPEIKGTIQMAEKRIEFSDGLDSDVFRLLV